MYTNSIFGTITRSSRKLGKYPADQWNITHMLAC